MPLESSSFLYLRLYLHSYVLVAKISCCFYQIMIEDSDSDSNVLPIQEPFPCWGKSGIRLHNVSLIIWNFDNEQWSWLLTTHWSPMFQVSSSVRWEAVLVLSPAFSLCQARMYDSVKSPDLTPWPSWKEKHDVIWSPHSEQLWSHKWKCTSTNRLKFDSCLQHRRYFWYQQDRRERQTVIVSVYGKLLSPAFRQMLS